MFEFELRGAKMKLVHTLITAGGLLGSGAVLAHGPHAEVPPESLLHLLAHGWPVLLVAITLAGAYYLLRKDRG
jgi:hypothetical protein